MERRRPGQDNTPNTESNARPQRSRPGHHEHAEVAAPSEPKLAYNAGGLATPEVKAYNNLNTALSWVDDKLGTDMAAGHRQANMHSVAQAEMATRDKMQANIEALEKTDRTAALATAATINDAALGTDKQTTLQNGQVLAPEAEKTVAERMASALAENLDAFKQIFSQENMKGIAFQETQTHSSQAVANVVQPSGPETGRG